MIGTLWQNFPGSRLGKVSLIPTSNIGKIHSRPRLELSVRDNPVSSSPNKYHPSNQTGVSLQITIPNVLEL
jgi:hypothetical protein